MAHFAHVKNGIVIPHDSGPSVIVINNEDCGGGEFPASEAIGQAFINSLGISGTWRQTSYNNNFRRKFAGEGYLYIEDADVFIEPSPYPSWVLDSNYEWSSPIPMPSIGGPYVWDESTLTWKPVEKPEQVGDTSFAVLE